MKKRIKLMRRPKRVCCIRNPEGPQTNRHHDCFTKKNPKTSSIDITYGTNLIDTDNTTV